MFGERHGILTFTSRKGRCEASSWVGRWGHKNCTRGCRILWWVSKHLRYVSFGKCSTLLWIHRDHGAYRTHLCCTPCTVPVFLIPFSDVRSTEQRALKKLRSPYTVHTYKLLAHLDFAGIDAREAFWGMTEERAVQQWVRKTTGISRCPLQYPCRGLYTYYNHSETHGRKSLTYSTNKCTFRDTITL